MPNPDFQNSEWGNFPTPVLFGQLLGHGQLAGHENLPEAAKAAMNHTSGWEPMPGVPYEGDPSSHELDPTVGPQDYVDNGE